VTKKSSAWMPFYVGDYLADTMHLTTVQHGAYFLLICHYWRTGPIVDDDGVLASICRMGKSEWTKNRAIIRRFFTARDGLLHQKRIDAELEFASGISEKRRAAANASWANRESKPAANAHANAPDLHMQNGMQNGAHAYMRDARQSQSQSESPREDTSLRSDASASQMPPDARSALWVKGVEAVHRMTGKPERACKTLIGKWAKDAKDDCAMLNAIIADCIEVRPGDPIAWITAGITARMKPPDKHAWLDAIGQSPQFDLEATRDDEGNYQV
jgi:uncharacterized protein YdaU (DUF1376 family)